MRSPLGSEAIVGVVGLLGAPQRRAGALVAADHQLLLGARDAVPELDAVADDAHHLVGAAGGPRRLAGARPHDAVHEAARRPVSGLAVPSLKPSRLRGAPGSLETGQEALDLPARRERAARRAHQVAQRVEQRLLAVGAQLHEHVAVALLGDERVVGEGRHRLQRARLARRQPVALVEERGAEGDRDGQAVGRHARAEDAGVGRRPLARRAEQGVVAARQPARALGERLERRGQLGARRRDRVERGEDRVRRRRA